MNARARPRRRWRLLAILLLLAFAAFFGLRALLQPERMGALILEHAARSTGLHFATAQPARLGLWPRLHLALVDVEVRQRPSAAPMLRAERLDIALPLATLWGGASGIGRIDLRAPDVDLDEVSAWLDGDLDAGPPSALILPQFPTFVRIDDGRLRTADFVIDGLTLALSPIRDGEPVRLSAAADFGAEAARRLTLELASVPRQREQGIALTELQLSLGRAGATGEALSASGEIDLFLPQTLRLDLALEFDQHWLLDLPQVPDALQPVLAGPFLLAYDGPGDFSGTASLHGGSDDARIAFLGRPRDLLDWLDAADASPLPPATLDAELPALDIEGVRIEGLKLELRPDPSP